MIQSVSDLMLDSFRSVKLSCNHTSAGIMKYYYYVQIEVDYKTVIGGVNNEYAVILTFVLIEVFTSFYSKGIRLGSSQGN